VHPSDARSLSDDAGIGEGFEKGCDALAGPAVVTTSR
jgi:hypothetical protein